MSLPKIELPLFELTIPSTKKKVKYRPFTVKEEKILLIAQESKDVDQGIIAIKQIINNCVEDIDVEKLALFDLEYILIALRIKSVNNNVTFTVTDPDTNEAVELEVDLENIELSQNEDHSNKIHINDDTFMIMRYPSVNELFLLKDQESMGQSLMEILTSCIEQIVAGDEVYQTEDFTREQVSDFIDTLPGDAIRGIESFFDSMPVMKHSIPYTNKNGDEKQFVIEGINTFFI